MLAANPRIQQQVSRLASTDFQNDLSWCEVTAAGFGANDPDQAAPGQPDLKKPLQDLAISLSAAHGLTHTVLVKWRDYRALSAGTSGTTYRIGFYPPELLERFLTKSKAAAESDAGLSLLGYPLIVSPIQVEQGYRFFLPVPPGWTDETLMTALVEQAGLNPDHILNFGYDVRKGAACNAPTGDMYFNYAPAGCINHGAEMLTLDGATPHFEILQPPSRFFVTHPASRQENHIKIRKAAACQDCWGPPRHGPCIYKGLCKMCLIPYDQMEYGGLRHACGQGDIYRPKQPAPFNPNMTSAESVPQPPSPLALSLKRKLEENLAKVRLQFQQQDPASGCDDFQEFDESELQDGTTRLELNQPGGKSPKRTTSDSPGR